MCILVWIFNIFWIIQEFPPPITIVNHHHGWHGRIPWKIRIIIWWNFSPSGGTSGRVDWPFLPSSPLSESYEELEESLGGSPPLPPIEEHLLDYIFEGSVDHCESPFCRLPNPTMLKFALSIDDASFLGFEGRTIAWGKGSWSLTIVRYMVRLIPYNWGPHLGPLMVEGRLAHSTWKVGGVSSCNSFFGLGCFISYFKMGASIVLCSLSLSI